MGYVTGNLGIAYQSSWAAKCIPHCRQHIQRQFALKKVRCPTGSEGVKEVCRVLRATKFIMEVPSLIYGQVMREVEAYRRFRQGASAVFNMKTRTYDPNKQAFEHHTHISTPKSNCSN